MVGDFGSIRMNVVSWFLWGICGGAGDQEKKWTVGGGWRIICLLCVRTGAMGSKGDANYEDGFAVY